MDLIYQEISLDNLASAFPRDLGPPVARVGRDGPADLGVSAARRSMPSLQRDLELAASADAATAGEPAARQTPAYIRGTAGPRHAGAG